MSFLDKLKQKAEELDLETKARQLQEAATQAAKQAQQKAGEFTTENREKIDGYIDAASSTIDEKTHGKYADTVAKVRAGVDKGIEKVAEGGSAAGATGAAAAAGATDTGPFPADPGAPAPDVPGPAVADVPTPTHEAVADSTLEDTVLGLDTAAPVEPPTDASTHASTDADPDADPTRPAGSAG
ncbi:Rv0909 family putative TA system antitoxin [Intrasporangium sp. YIM S08009]|uniref:Rv0909 family putative TA system antitoxin n=1 Tax=Intrasporangium zincisolvens TaxID=3080018 RepID=UPI002B0588FD|nr:Rv0909 family putative TA system antitoxin [Intrasporangium sp. YIM S08009]